MRPSRISPGVPTPQPKAPGSCGEQCLLLTAELGCRGPGSEELQAGDGELCAPSAGAEQLHQDGQGAGQWPAWPQAPCPESRASVQAAGPWQGTCGKLPTQQGSLVRKAGIWGSERGFPEGMVMTWWMAALEQSPAPSPPSWALVLSALPQPTQPRRPPGGPGDRCSSPQSWGQDRAGLGGARGTCQDTITVAGVGMLRSPLSER